jgi:hypothetical protein
MRVLKQLQFHNITIRQYENLWYQVGAKQAMVDAFEQGHSLGVKKRRAGESIARDCPAYIDTGEFRRATRLPRSLAECRNAHRTFVERLETTDSCGDAPSWRNCTDWNPAKVATSEPVFRLQLKQWQCPTQTGLPESRNRTAPHRQPPSDIASFITGTSTLCDGAAPSSDGMGAPPTGITESATASFNRVCHTLWFDTAYLSQRRNTS